jgi:uncharacterized protein
VSTTPFFNWLRSVEPKLPEAGAAAVLKLQADGATVPFIARYRKEHTGNLDEVQIRAVIDAKQRFDRVVARQAFVVEAIERQKKLTPELREKILQTFDADALEDLYLPYKQKKTSRAAQAREAGLQQLADWIWNCAHGSETPQPGQTLELWAFTFRNAEKGYADAAAAIDGAADILTERLAEQPELRQFVRAKLFGRGFLYSSKTDAAKPASKFDKYFDHKEQVKALQLPQNSHRYLAMRRGESEGELQLRIGGPPDDTRFDETLLLAFENAAAAGADSPGREVLKRAARAALVSYVAPSIHSEVHRALKAAADEAAIAVFASNLRRLLLEAPFGPKAVLGVDPGLRSGCKLAVVDGTGRFVANDVLQLEGDAAKAEARQKLDQALGRADVQALAVGNGTGGREAESFLRGALRELGRPTPVVMVSEAGASVYSASDLARAEFPELDVTVRGAISIARRLQDPLAELVKIEPKSIGVGQYQHDVAQHLLKRSLDDVVDGCVNLVGVNLNTASEPLLARVSGIGPALAQAVVARRAGKGLFRSRQELLEVPRFSKKAFEQAAGFLRVPESENPLDNTAVHPERYAALGCLAERLGKQLRDLVGAGAGLVKDDAALKHDVGALTHADIVAELEKPGRDPRPAFTMFQYREDVKELKDLKPGMVCPGIVTNVTSFGAFVDVGVHQDGLVHVSQIADKPVKDPSTALFPGQRVSVRVLEVNLDKKQIALTMKTPRERPKPKPAPRRPEARRAPAPRPPAAVAAKAAPPPRPAPRSAPRPAPRPAAPPRPPAARPAPRPSFNNPFAVLADLKKDLKDKR